MHFFLSKMYQIANKWQKSFCYTCDEFVLLFQPNEPRIKSAIIPTPFSQFECKYCSCELKQNLL